MTRDPEPALAAPHGRRRRLPRLLVLVIGTAALLGQIATAPVAAAQVWTKNLYDARAFLYQDPYSTACTAASTMIMLNTIAYRHTGGRTFRWTPYLVKNSSDLTDLRDMTSVLDFARSHDTLSASGAGSDPHGWRNALNMYGWGTTAMTDPAQRVYDDQRFRTYDAAVHAAVRAIARYDMPVGIVTWAGRHAQVMTGYVVTGENPRISDAFEVQYVDISDPLYNDHYVNARISNSALKAGTLHIRFQTYRETDSPFVDQYLPGASLRSSVAPTTGPSEWYYRWVIIAPVRGFSTLVPRPVATPTPSLSPAPSPSASG